MRCKRCGYDLRELQEHRCPECGRPFDPKRPATWLSKPVSGRKNLWLAIGAAVLFIIPLALSIAGDLHDYFQASSPTPVRIAVVLLVGPGFMITAVAIESVVFWTSSLVLLNHRPWVTNRKMFYASFPISLTVVAYFYGQIPFGLIHGLVDTFL